MSHHKSQACIDACLACSVECEECATSCINMNDKNHDKCISLCRDCADICALCALAEKWRPHWYPATMNRNLHPPEDMGPFPWLSMQCLLAILTLTECRL